MPAISHPPKHLVREYLERRTRDPKPPPSPEEIRRQLGWGMLMPASVKLATPRQAVPSTRLEYQPQEKFYD